MNNKILKVGKKIDEKDQIKEDNGDGNGFGRGDGNGFGRGDGFGFGTHSIGSSDGDGFVRGISISDSDGYAFGDGISAGVDMEDILKQIPIKYK